jgi:hypothetical protein
MESYVELKKRLLKVSNAKGYNPRTGNPLGVMVNWLEKTICGTQPKQSVVGNRPLVEGGTVTQEMFDRQERAAHVCPFVRNSLDANLFWFEESPLGRGDQKLIEQRLSAMVDEFQNMDPAHHPQPDKVPAIEPSVLKAFLLIFPNLHVRGGGGVSDKFMDDVHAAIKPAFVANGLMLGQFYPSCPFEGIYNQSWLALTSPIPAFAARYMVRHDRPFIPNELMSTYEKFFPPIVKEPNLS